MKHQFIRVKLSQEEAVIVSNILVRERESFKDYQDRDFLRDYTRVISNAEYKISRAVRKLAPETEEQDVDKVELLS